jgi:hypothetical protein
LRSMRKFCPRRFWARSPCSRSRSLACFGEIGSYSVKDVLALNVDACSPHRPPSEASGGEPVGTVPLIAGGARDAVRGTSRCASSNCHARFHRGRQRLLSGQDLVVTCPVTDMVRCGPGSLSSGSLNENVRRFSPECGRADGACR